MLEELDTSDLMIRKVPFILPIRPLEALKGLTNYIVRSVLQQHNRNKSRCVNNSFMSSTQNIYVQ